MFFSEEGSSFGKRHFSVLLQQPDIELCGLILRPWPPGHPGGGDTLRQTLRNTVWRLAFTMAGATPAIDLTAFSMPTEASIRGIPVLRPKRLKSASFLKKIHSLKPDVILCAGHQQIFPAALLGLPSLGALNFHPSLLPEGRGRNPCFWTIVTGQTETGVTVHFMTTGIDQGDIVVQRAIPLNGSETYTSLYQTLSTMSADLIPETLHQLKSETLQRIPQSAGGKPFREPVEADYRIDWTKQGDCIQRLIRAGMNAPGAYTEWRDTRVIVCDGTARATGVGAPGEIRDISPEGVEVGCKAGSVVIIHAQIDGDSVPVHQLATHMGWRVGDQLS